MELKKITAFSLALLLLFSNCRSEEEEKAQKDDALILLALLWLQGKSNNPPAPKLLSVEPQNGTFIEKLAKLELKFDQEMDTARSNYFVTLGGERCYKGSAFCNLESSEDQKSLNVTFLRELDPGEEAKGLSVEGFRSKNLVAMVKYQNSDYILTKKIPPPVPIDTTVSPQTLFPQNDIAFTNRGPFTYSYISGVHFWKNYISSDPSLNFTEEPITVTSTQLNFDFTSLPIGRYYWKVQPIFSIDGQEIEGRFSNTLTFRNLGLLRINGKEILNPLIEDSIPIIFPFQDNKIERSTKETLNPLVTIDSIQISLPDSETQSFSIQRSKDDLQSVTQTNNGVSEDLKIIDSEYNVKILINEKENGKKYFEKNFAPATHIEGKNQFSKEDPADKNLPFGFALEKEKFAVCQAYTYEYTPDYWRGARMLSFKAIPATIQYATDKPNFQTNEWAAPQVDSQLTTFIFAKDAIIGGITQKNEQECYQKCEDVWGVCCCLPWPLPITPFPCIVGRSCRSECTDHPYTIQKGVRAVCSSFKQNIIQGE